VSDLRDCLKISSSAVIEPQRCSIGRSAQSNVSGDVTEAAFHLLKKVKRTD